jgi:hypothetical protein
MNDIALAVGIGACLVGLLLLLAWTVLFLAKVAA